MKKYVPFPFLQSCAILLFFSLFFSQPSNAFLDDFRKKNVITLDKFAVQKENLELYSNDNYKPILKAHTNISSWDNAFTGTGNFPGSGNINIIFSGQINSNGFISQPVFTFGGIHGTINLMGNISQYVNDGATIYQQSFSETYILPFGRMYTRYFVVFGKVNGNSAKVSAMETASFT